MARILVVEDHESIREGVAAYLRQDGHEVETRSEGNDLLAVATRFDLFLLDVMLPGRDGFSLARDLRKLTPAPFLFLTARGDEAERLAGWELGASDYVVKPFSPRELVHRVRAILRRRTAEPAQALVRAYVLPGSRVGVHRLEFDDASRKVFIDGDEVLLTPGEWAFIDTFTARPGVALSRRELMSGALQYYVDTGERTVDTHMKNLRAKLGEQVWIETVRGVGYRFAGLRV
ncbi:MAG: response regulator transcription factor [Spirochaetales bacterium]